MKLVRYLEKDVELIGTNSLFFLQDTGCGKTTVVQLMSVLLNRELQIVNCHASTETSDLLGGLRPLRGRRLIMEKLITAGNKIYGLLDDLPALKLDEVPELLKDKNVNSKDIEDIPPGAVQQIMSFVKAIRSKLQKLIRSGKSSQCEKKRKLENGDPQKIHPITASDQYEALLSCLSTVESLYQQYVSLFEWVDGPLVNAMKRGHLFLLDEMSLAEDAVLERLNSVLEPSRTLTLAEKGGDVDDEDSGKSSLIRADDDFRVFATMNPGGDFGKRELSPALRSRFTEIWVPAVTDCSDIDLVLERALATSSMAPVMLSQIKIQMLDYVNWFNNSICAKPLSTCAEFVLSLRDVLAWARFIIDTNKCGGTLGSWAAYVHGASLMHLDGLGLGTGLTYEDAITTKNQAKKYLREQVPYQQREKYLLGFENELDGIDDNHLQQEQYFGIDPFFISTGPEPIPKRSDFKMSAPTTALNLRRVLRAMQISKPILLEGSPGVGKTSLIAALASMSGHTLVRINLSEQTDITDLMGSDLPVPEDNDSSGASFKWCDGALLRAIKNGHWVLLDELNLASQSVLEGLNSCLDHRASVYIPELGQTFDCPPTFRIFAAQNPLAQGGGRKGLPKSFLNRFTKVYVEALAKEDLRGIVSKKFPMILPGTVEQIVKFNCFVQEDINNRKYGQLGSPWEFNLRDVFRWCELVSASYKKTGEVDCGKFADIIYTQRLRSEDDRYLLMQRYKECFGDISCFTRVPHFDVFDKHLEVGNAKVKRSELILSSSEGVLLGEQPAHLRALARPLEAVAFCIQMNWPCLLVGSPATGKSTVLKIMAEACNMKLEEITLTPSSDVNELIGCFEQIDAVEIENRLLKSLGILCSCASTTLINTDVELSYLQKINSLNVLIQNSVKEVRKTTGTPLVFDRGDLLATAKKLVTVAMQASSHFEKYSKVCKKIIILAKEDICRFQQKDNSNNGTVHFRWVDGILVTALEKGYWLHLENVNFCPSSVLDRLNPLMETDGVLVLTECGIQEDGGKKGYSRIVKPHPNFRLFLSTNPSFGEVSRAMRNRCIEVSLLPPAVSNIGNICKESKGGFLRSSTQSIDGLGLLSQVGISSASLAKHLILSHVEEFCGDEGLNTGNDDETSRSVKECAMLVMDALHRGFMGNFAVKMAEQLVYGKQSYEAEFDALKGEHFGNERLIENIQIRNVLSRTPVDSFLASDARLIRAMEKCNSIPLGHSNFGRDNHDSNSSLLLPLDKYAPSLSSSDSRFPAVRHNLIANFIIRSTVNDSTARSHFLIGYNRSVQKAISSMTSKYISATNLDQMLLHLFVQNRMSILYSEHELFSELKQTAQNGIKIEKLGPMELSHCIYENQVDRSQIGCPVIPIIYPLFKAIDAFLATLDNITKFNGTSDNEFEYLARFLSSRDRLWIFLKTARVLNNSTFLGFDETGFLVHWNWLKKSLSFLDDNIHYSDYSNMKGVKRQLDLLILTIDKELLISNGSLRSISNKFWKSLGHPLMPANATDWASINMLRQQDITLSLIDQEMFGFIQIASGIRKSLMLEDLIACHHPSLSVTNKIKSEILSALCMAHWTTTDEMSSSIRKEKKNYDISKTSLVLSNEIKSAREEMERTLQLHAVDVSVHFDSNKLDVEDLEKLKEACSQNFEDGGADLIQSLLSTFARIQSMQAVEFWCVKEEKWIIKSLAAAVNSESDNRISLIRKKILPRIKAFIEVVVNQTVWPVSDLRPLQSILWAMESSFASNSSLLHLFRCMYSTLLVTSTKHNWCNSFNNLHCISDTLCCPPFWNSKTKQSVQPINSEEIFGFDMGSIRLQHNVISACIFRMLGLNRDTIYSSQKYPYLTLENFEARQAQTKDVSQFLFQDLSVLDENLSSFDVLVFFIDNIIHSLYNVYEDSGDVLRLRSYLLGEGELVVM